MLFTRYDFMHDAKPYQQRLVDFAVRSKDGTTLEEVETARRFYEECVGGCVLRLFPLPAAHARACV